MSDHHAATHACACMMPCIRHAIVEPDRARSSPIESVHWCGVGACEGRGYHAPIFSARHFQASALCRSRGAHGTRRSGWVSRRRSANVPLSTDRLWPAGGRGRPPAWTLVPSYGFRHHRRRCPPPRTRGHVYRTDGTAGAADTCAVADLLHVQILYNNAFEMSRAVKQFLESDGLAYEVRTAVKYFIRIR